MSEIRLDVDLRHPPDVVWQALTEQPLLARWFMLTDLSPEAGSRFQLLPEDLPGLPNAVDGEVIEAIPARRLAMRWQGEQLHSKVIWELAPTPAGCRLVVTQTGFLGLRGSARRRALVSTYKRLFEVRLPAVLDGVVPPSPPRLAGVAPAGPDRRRQLLAVLAAALLVALVGALVANLPAKTSEPAVAQTGIRAGQRRP
ncbi:SRPBCC family protein [Phytohabitans rumicis]|uniref:Activator of Hsp90 ATPase homologue 1/2-like C-terminal domain-containing protein n=1 Tax=Phytohabitans rumicis TaxID=1076125 RepID=A0A6V8LBT6_9ACTN|nr:SRPBCC domain-containing protein [Phytohabitans rumicis]GFJ91546.1 hypothetical protein Prum_051880 [Phytohabitans rumicis]